MQLDDFITRVSLDISAFFPELSVLTVTKHSWMALMVKDPLLRTSRVRKCMVLEATQACLVGVHQISLSRYTNNLLWTFTKREICISLRIVFFASRLLQRNAKAGCEFLLITGGTNNSDWWWRSLKYVKSAKASTDVPSTVSQTTPVFIWSQLRLTSTS